MIRYLVTGGCGFIGSHLVKALLKKGYSVRVLDDLSNGDRRHLPEEVELIIGSITDSEKLKKAIDGVGGCFHLAAITSVQQSIKPWSKTTEINLMGTVRVFETIAGSSSLIPIIYASSASVYGNCPNLPLKEEYALNPLSPYGVDKMACELHARIGWIIHNIPSIGFRLFNVYGPLDTLFTPYSNVITLFTQKIYKKEKITIFGDGMQSRDFIYVGDVVRMMIQAMEQKFERAEVYNLCSGRGVSIIEIANLLEKITDTEVIKEFAPPRKGEIRLSIGDSSKAKRILRLETKVSLEQGLEATVKCSNRV